jgi:sugar lactone lactonase YvrE
VNANGKPQKVSGSPYYDTITVVEVNDHTVEITRAKNGKKVQKETLTASDNGAQTYIADAHNATIAVSANDGKFRTLAKGIRGTSLAVSHDGNIYVAEAGIRGKNSGKIWLVRPNGQKSQLDEGLNFPAGVAISPDGLWLAASENQTH